MGDVSQSCLWYRDDLLSPFISGLFTFLWPLSPLSFHLPSASFSAPSNSDALWNLLQQPNPLHANLASAIAIFPSICCNQTDRQCTNCAFQLIDKTCFKSFPTFDCTESYYWIFWSFNHYWEFCTHRIPLPLKKHPSKQGFAWIKTSQFSCNATACPQMSMCLATPQKSIIQRPSLQLSFIYLKYLYTVLSSTILLSRQLKNDTKISTAESCNQGSYQVLFPVAGLISIKAKRKRKDYQWWKLEIHL